MNLPEKLEGRGEEWKWVGEGGADEGVVMKDGE